jgi:addiction module RelE/StbE family toxin
MKKVIFSPTFQKKLSQLKKKDARLLLKIKKQLLLFETNPRHPSLRLHKLSGELKDVWSLSITMNFRLLFVDDGEYYFFEIGTHEQVYGK